MASHIGRRKFLATLGGAFTWSLAARAQQPAMPVIGMLNPQSLAASGHLLDAFRRGLGEIGYVEGQNVAIEYRLSEGRIDQRVEMAADLIRRQVSVIAAPGTAVARVATTATQTIPIVFGVSDDPVKLGLVASLAHPGGNATGVNSFISEVNAKRLGLLRELVPTAARLAVLVNPANPTNTSSVLADVEPAARALGLQLQIYNASTSGEIDAAFAALVRERPDALFLASDGLFSTRRVQLISLAARHALPASYASRESVEAGGLMSYGSSLVDMYRQVGVYVGRILKGAKPADLPVAQASKFELVINLQTAKLLGLEVPPTLLARADEVIE
jgi:putative tryptophan/tyrosine transport system substrate-binding protein